MPVLETERVAPRSALRYQPHQVTDQARQTQPAPQVSRRSRVRADASAPAVRAIPDDLEEERGASPPGRKSITAVPRRRSRSSPPVRARRRVSLPLLLGGGLIAFVLVWVGVNQALLWGNTILNDLRFGYPRTFQVDAVIGHQDSANAPSHFLAINLHGQIEVVEWPGGDASRARVYVLQQLVGPGSDLEPVTLQFLDLTGDHLPDMVITVQHTQVALINDHSTFREVRPEEQKPIMQRLRELGLAS